VYISVLRAETTFLKPATTIKRNTSTENIMRIPGLSIALVAGTLGRTLLVYFHTFSAAVIEKIEYCDVYGYRDRDRKKSEQ
jgi:hypothetical protein